MENNVVLGVEESISTESVGMELTQNVAIVEKATVRVMGTVRLERNSAKVQNVRVSEGITYMEALKRVEKNAKTSTRKADKVEKSSTVHEHVSSQRISENTMLTDKISFTAFIAEVVNCSAQSCTERIRLILSAGRKYLDAEGVTVEHVNEKLKVQIVNTQAACGGS